MTNDLNSMMEFDHVVRVEADGFVDFSPKAKLWAPEVFIDTDEDGQISRAHEEDMERSIAVQGWELLKGFTGQYLAGNTGIMHPSEFVGGNLADHILSTPGYYAVVSVETLDDNEDAVGWAVVYRETVPAS